MNWQATVEKTVTALGYELVDAERSAGGMLRVFIDKPPAITLDDCERVTRQLRHVLEVEQCDYARLEVSSPGLDRPLKKAADWARFCGETIELTLRMPFAGRRKYQGVLGADGEAWRIVFHDGKAEQALAFTLAEVREARLVPVIDFKGRPKVDNHSATPAADAVPQPGNDDLDGGLNR